MASINTYELDSIINPQDKVIGTDGTTGADAGKTKNFSISSLQSYININAPIPGLQAVITSGNLYVSGQKRWQWNPTKFEHTDGDTGTGFAISGNEGFVLTNDTGFDTGRSSLGISQLQVGNGSLYKTTILGTNATLNRTINLPNSSGTFALLSDLPSSTPWNLESGTGINYVAGNVGIGTVSGSSALTVSGEINSTSIETSGLLVEGNATINNSLTAASVTATTLSGNLVGTIDTTTTGTTQPSTTDNNLIATTAFVQDLLGDIVSGLQFQELWDANTDTPDLSGATPSNGDFWIVKVDGATNLSGITSWVVGDWAIYIVPSGGGTAFWQKVDNTSGISGTGTGNQVTKWSGSGASTTLTDGIITDNGTNVGIGTTVPTAKLDVSGSVMIQNALTVDNDATFNSEVNVGTTNIIGGSISLTSNSLNKLHIVDTNVIEVLGDGGVNLKSSDGLTLSVSDLFEFKGGAGLTVYNGASLTANLDVSQITASRTYQFPDDSGTLALFTDIPSGLINGTGTAGYITKWQDVDTLNDSVLFELSDKIGLGTITPTAQLETTEDILVHGITIGTGATTYTSTDSNFENSKLAVALGQRSLRDNTTGLFSTAVGYQTLMKNTTGLYNTAVGLNTMRDNLTGSRCTAVGSGALSFNGSVAMTSTEGYQNSAFGFSALQSNVDGTSNTAVGNDALKYSVSGDNNVALGSYAAIYYDTNVNLTSVTKGVFLGAEIEPLTNNSNNEIVIGYGVIGLGSNTVVIGDSNITKTRLQGNVGIGTDSPTAQIHTTEDILVHGITVGKGAHDVANTNSFGNTTVGLNALDNNTTGYQLTSVGNDALKVNTTGTANSAIGYRSLYSNTTGYQNVGIGSGALLSNTTGSSNIAIGNNSIKYSNGDKNVSVGEQALLWKVGGDGAVAMGWRSGYVTYENPANNVTTVNNSVFVGNETKPLASSSTHEIIIGGLAKGLGNNTAVIGSALYTTKTRLHGNVGIGTDAPTAQIHTTEDILVHDVLTVGLGATALVPGDTTYPGYLMSVVAGNDALTSNLYGTGNIAIGHKVLKNNVGNVADGQRGSSNIGIGREALINNTEGYGNVAIGYFSMQYNTGNSPITSPDKGSGNVALGGVALNRNRLGNFNTGCGWGSMYYNQDGDFNTALGHGAGQNWNNTPNPSALSNSTEGVFLGAKSKAFANDSVNEIVIGYDANGLGSNTTVLGNSSITKTRIHGSVVAAGDVEVSTVAKGFILKSPDGTRFRIAVANDGTLSASAV